MYFIFTFESMRDFSLDIPRLLEEYIIIYLSPTSAAAGWGAYFLKAQSLILTVVRREKGTETSHVVSFKGDIVADMNGLYTENRVEYMLEIKIYNQLDSFFHPWQLTLMEQWANNITTVGKLFILTSPCYDISSVVDIWDIYKCWSV